MGGQDWRFCGGMHRQLDHSTLCFRRANGEKVEGTDICIVVSAVNLPEHIFVMSAHVECLPSFPTMRFRINYVLDGCYLLEFLLWTSLKCFSTTLECAQNHRFRYEENDKDDSHKGKTVAWVSRGCGLFFATTTPKQCEG